MGRAVRSALDQLGTSYFGCRNMLQDRTRRPVRKRVGQLRASRLNGFPAAARSRRDGGIGEKGWPPASTAERQAAGERWYLSAAGAAWLKALAAELPGE